MPSSAATTIGVTDGSFRGEVLVAYGYRCAVCDFDARLGILVGSLASGVLGYVVLAASVIVVGGVLLFRYRRRHYYRHPHQIHQSRRRATSFVRRMVMTDCPLGWPDSHC